MQIFLCVQACIHQFIMPYIVVCLLCAAYLPMRQLRPVRMHPRVGTALHPHIVHHTQETHHAARTTSHCACTCLET